MPEIFGKPASKCPKCGVAIGEEHPYTYCRECGEILPEDRPALASEEVEKLTAAAAPAPATITSYPVCIFLGGFLLLCGLYFLILAPGTSSSPFGAETVNLQRLTIGQTLSVMGSVFLAVGLRNH